MKFNSLLTGLIGLAIFLLIVLGLYQIFLRPPENPPSSDITPINDYYGEDVYTFLETGNTGGPAPGQQQAPQQPQQQAPQ
jgi:hypothetical protein